MENQVDKDLLNVAIVRRQIMKRVEDKRNIGGSFFCPICGMGQVHYYVTFNGHVHARCDSDKCVNWME
jgi:hypothetical protein